MLAAVTHLILLWVSSRGYMGAFTHKIPNPHLAEWHFLPAVKETRALLCAAQTREEPC